MTQPNKREAGQFVADLIGGDITASRVNGIVEAFETAELIVHGVKRATLIETALANGIEPRTPEGGNVSFWARGWGIFMVGNEASLGGTFDTPFFNYGHVSETGIPTSCLAVASLGRLAQAGITLKERTPQLTIAETVPSSEIEWVLVQDGVERPDEDARRQAQRLEQATFYSLEAIAYYGFSPSVATGTIHG